MEQTDETRFAGEVILGLAADGRLRVDRERADRLIAELETTLTGVRNRLGLVAEWQRLPLPRTGELSGELVDAAFLDQLSPGKLERALEELPKYIRALQLARSPGNTVEIS